MSGPGDVTGSAFLRGALYLGTASWITYAFNFAIVIVVARLLGPEAFGLYAFAVAVNEFINIVQGFSIGGALIQSEEESQTLHDTGYAANFALGLLGLLIACAVAPFLWIHRSPTAAWFILVLAGVRILVLLTNVAYVQLDRRYRYGSIAAIQLGSRTAPNLIGLGLAATGWGPWSLILRDVLMNAVPFFLVHWSSGYRFAGRVSREALRRIMSFSVPMFAARTLDIVLQRFDGFMVGSLLGNAAIGLYHQSRYVSEAGQLAVTPVTRVSFNLYARLQTDTPRLARSHSIVTYFLLRLFLGGSVVLLVYPAEVVRLLLGSEWLEMAPILRILGLYGGLLPVLDNLKMLLYGRAHMRANLRLRIAQLAVFLPGVVLSVRAGSLEGVAASLLAATLTGVVMGSWSNWDVVRLGGAGVYASPVVALLVTVLAFGVGHAAAPLQTLPWWLLPFLPPLAFWLIIAALDRGRLLRELRYLRGQMSAGSR